MARKSKNYLNNKDLHYQISMSLQQDKLTPDAEKMLVLIAEKAINRMTYLNNDDRLDCIQFAILDLFKYWRNFNPDFANAFAYFTEIAKRGYAKGWGKLHPKKYKGTLSIDKELNNSEKQGGIYNI